MQASQLHSRQSKIKRRPRHPPRQRPPRKRQRRGKMAPRLAIAPALQTEFGQQYLGLLGRGRRHIGEGCQAVEHVAGVAQPAQFPVAPASRQQLIEQLTRCVLCRAMQQCRMWLEKGLHLPVSVNVSATDLQDGFAQLVAGLLDANGVTPECLRLEITEGVDFHTNCAAA